MELMIFRDNKRETIKTIDVSVTKKVVRERMEREREREKGCIDREGGTVINC